jgi:hypothetical protein
MRTWLAAAIVGTTVAAGAVSAQDTRTSSSLERPFPANGRVTMDLVAGDYQITGSPENRVRLEWKLAPRCATATCASRPTGRATTI